MSIAELIGLSQKDAYDIAEIAHQFLSVGKSKEAIQILEGLLVLNPEDIYLQNLLKKAQNHASQFNHDTRKT